MSEQVGSSSQPKTPRKSSRSHTPKIHSDQSIPPKKQGQGQSEGRPGRGGRRGGRGGANQQQRQTSEVDATVTHESQGDFDVDGNGNPLANKISSEAQAGVKKRSNQKPRNNSSHHTEVPVPASLQQLPFPTLRGTPHKPYAGPTFHASPAASALPMPKFFSKSVPTPASNAPSLQERVDQETAEQLASQQINTPEQSPSAGRAHPTPLHSRTESPLDIFFSAARAEKAKQQYEPARQSPGPPAQHSLSPVHAAMRPVSQNTTRPYPATDKPPSHWASIYGGSRPSHQRNYSADSSKGLFAMDMDSKTQLHLPHSPQQSIQPIPVAESSTPVLVQRTVSDSVHNTPFYRELPTYTDAKNSASRPCPPSDVEANSANRQVKSPFYHQNQSSTERRSASHTSLQTPPSSKHHAQSLHYGNKNLSPMFQAAKNNSPRNQSQLRQELPYSPITSANELPNSVLRPEVMNNKQQAMTSNHANIAAQKYLADMISRTSSNNSSPAHGHSAPPQTRYHNGALSPPSGPHREAPYLTQQSVSGSASTRSMEDDLRRMLKISEQPSKWYG